MLNDEFRLHSFGTDKSSSCQSSLANNINPLTFAHSSIRLMLKPVPFFPATHEISLEDAPIRILQLALPMHHSVEPFSIIIPAVSKLVYPFTVEFVLAPLTFICGPVSKFILACTLLEPVNI